jgi:spore germination protein GerM
VARKTTKKTTRKKSPARSKPATGKSSKSTTARATGTGKNPLYVLVIMGLITAIALMINRYYLQHEPPKEQAAQQSEPEKVPVEEKNERRELTEEKKSKTDKSEKAVTSKSQEKEEQTKTPEKEEVKLYFVKFNEKSEKMLLTPVTRKVGPELPLENTMRELIKGPSTAEKKKGLLTAVPSNLRVNGIRLKNGIAEIDFNGAIEQGAGGSVLINRIDQIVYTATQFPHVKSVVIKINGRPRQTLGTDGLSIGGPLHRRQ